MFVYIAIETADQQYQSVKLANETLVLIKLERHLKNSDRGKKEINRKPCISANKTAKKLKLYNDAIKRIGCQVQG